MKLVVISNMAHYVRDNTIVGHGSTARELSEVARLFTEVRHVACLHAEAAPASALPYTAPNLTLVPVPPAGGSRIVDKLSIGTLTPLYLRTIARELSDADAVHVRCPANISMYALGFLTAQAAPARRWVKYAGSWNPSGPEPFTYGLQRRWLARGLTRSEVTVNGSWPNQPSHVHPFVNPCLNDEEVATGRRYAASKKLGRRVRLLFVGHMGHAKNPDAAIDAIAELLRREIEASLDIVGEGDVARLREQAKAHGITDRVTFHGPLPRRTLETLYRDAHFIVLPSRTEGWPKVLSEGMAYGAVPIATAVGSIPETLAALQVGAILGSGTGRAIADSIQTYVTDRERWGAESLRGAESADSFTYSRFVESVRTLLRV